MESCFSLRFLNACYVTLLPGMESLIYSFCIYFRPLEIFVHAHNHIMKQILMWRDCRPLAAEVWFI